MHAGPKAAPLDRPLPRSSVNPQHVRKRPTLANTSQRCFGTSEPVFGLRPLCCMAGSQNRAYTIRRDLRICAVGRSGTALSPQPVLSSRSEHPVEDVGWHFAVVAEPVDVD